MSNIIEFSNVTKRFGQFKALNQASLAVPDGAIFGFLGNNGAGKSTSVRAMLGLLQIDAGEIRLFNKSISSIYPSAYKDIGCIVDTPTLYQHLTAKEYLSISCTLKSLKKSEIDRVLSLVDLTEHKNSKIDTFSLGMKQRLAIASTLLGDPKLLILDEPTNGLDPQGMQDIRHLLMTLPEISGATVFISSHLLDEVEKLVTHVGVISQGSVNYCGELSGLIGQGGELLLDVGCVESALPVLQKSGFTIKRTHDNQILIDEITQLECAKLHKLIIENGVDLLQSRFSKTSLESVFLQSQSKVKGVMA